MSPADRPAKSHDRLVVAGVGAGFLVLVAGVLALYVAGIQVFHLPIRGVAPTVARFVRAQAGQPTHLVVGAAVVVIIVALFALLLHDGRQPEPGARADGTAPDRLTPRGERDGG